MTRINALPARFPVGVYLERPCGSMTELVGQKISLHRQLPNLRVQRFELVFGVVLPDRAPLKQLPGVVDQLAAPVLDRCRDYGCSRPKPTVDSFRDDPLFPRVERAVADILANGKVVATVDVLVRMDLLAPEKLEDRRLGRVPYLEKVIHCNLTRLARLLRILRLHAHDLNLVRS